MNEAARYPGGGRGSGGVTGRGFRPGQSGNPGGRPAGLAAAIREATKDGEELVAFVLRVFRGESIGTGKGASRPRVADRMAAATWLADRGFGRPVQGFLDIGGTEEDEGRYDLTKLTDEELAASRALLAKARRDI